MAITGGEYHHKIDLPPPIRVSPFIRACRWVALLSGISYGLIRHRQLTKKENKIRAYEEEQRPIREAKLAIEKKRILREELLYLAKESGTPIPANFEDQFK